MSETLKFCILLFGIPAVVVIIMHQLEIFNRRLWPIVVRYLNFKPFTCELCLSFWAYLITGVLINGFTIYNLVASFIAGLIGYLYSLKFIKF